MDINEFQRRADARVTIFDAIQTKERSWPADKWVLAVLGELGELANLLKKVERRDLTLEAASVSLRKECADVVTYGFALMTCLGGDMEHELTSKFDEVSRRWVIKAEALRMYDLANQLRAGLMTNPESPKCYHPRSAMGNAVMKNGICVRGCDPGGTYVLHYCLACGAEVWDNDFTTAPEIVE